jgi:hypothetical protein
MLQCDEMMEHVYENNKWVHASRKCFEKTLMYMKDGIPIPNSKMPTPTSTAPNSKISTPKLEAFTFDLFGSLNSKPSIGDGEWMATKVKMLYNQSKCMATRASHFAFTFKIVSKMEVNNE